MVWTESYLLSLAIGRIHTPRRRCARFRPDLLHPASLIFQNRVRMARLARTL